MIRQEIIKQYIATLKEDGELDYIFPLLLERMGYRVLSTPKNSKGQSQFGRDVVAIKKIKKINTLFLFELKGFRAKDITDRTLTEKDGIIDSLKASKYTKYKDASIPDLHNFPRRYVFVHNGGIDANAQPTWDGFVESEFPEGNLERWDLGKLTTLFSEYLFDETLLMDEESYRLFKRALVLIDAEGNDYSDISKLIELQIVKIKNAKKTNHRTLLNFFATMRLIASMVYAYAMEANNLIPAKFCIDTMVLKTWAWVLENKNEKKKVYVEHFNKLVLLQIQIYEEYINKVLRFANMEKGLYAYNASDTEFVFYPLRCFDFLGDLIYYFTATEAYARIPKGEVVRRSEIVKTIIKNNNACCTPLLDTHSIVIQMVFKYMYLHQLKDENFEFIVDYLYNTVLNLLKRYTRDGMWPEMYGNRMALAKSLYEKDDAYNCDSSLLLLNVIELIAYMNIPDLYAAFIKIVNESGVNLQVAYPNWDEYDIEQRLFEHRLDEEIPVESDIKLPETLEEFRNTFKKKYRTVKYRTDKVGYDFLRVLAHKYYETDLFPDYLGRGFCEE
jgi:hypothetical protein